MNFWIDPKWHGIIYYQPSQRGGWWGWSFIEARVEERVNETIWYEEYKMFMKQLLTWGKNQINTMIFILLQGKWFTSAFGRWRRVTLIEQQPLIVQLCKEAKYDHQVKNINFHDPTQVQYRHLSCFIPCCLDGAITL
jgi:hypothetical protein